jgi:hypothetical protein
MSRALSLSRLGRRGRKPDMPATTTDVSTTPRGVRARSGLRGKGDLRPAPHSAMLSNHVHDLLV